MHGLYEKLQSVFGQFPKYHIKTLFGGFTAKTGTESALETTTGSLMVIGSEQ